MELTKEQKHLRWCIKVDSNKHIYLDNRYLNKHIYLDNRYLNKFNFLKFLLQLE